MCSWNFFGIGKFTKTLHFSMANFGNGLEDVVGKPTFEIMNYRTLNERGD